MKPLFLGLLIVVATLATAQGKQKFTGTVTDSMCPAADHSRMRMGSTDGECAIACINAHGAAYVLYDGKDAYTLSGPQSPEKFAGKRVSVTGTMDAKTKTIQVESITVSN